MRFIKRKFFNKLGFLSVLVIMVLALVGWRYTNLPIYKLVVHEIHKASEDNHFTVSNMKVSTAVKSTVTAATYTAGTGYTIDLSTGNYFTIDLTDKDDECTLGASSSGVTFYVPAPTAANDDSIFTIQKIDSGTTEPCLYVEGGLPLETASGVTDADMDAQGDVMTIRLAYNSAVSAWVVNEKIH